VTVSRKSQASRASAWERRKSAQVLEARAGAGSIPASVKISHTVEAATFTPRTSSSPWILRYPQLGFSRARRSTRARMERTGAWPARAFRPGDGRVTAGEQVAMPAQHSVGAYQQPHSAQHVARQPVQQGRQQHPIGPVEPDLLLAHLAFQHGDLMAQGKGFHVLVPIAHGQ
jgi:uncharacterized protein YkwD